jgi:hypothetical protein
MYLIELCVYLSIIVDYNVNSSILSNQCTLGTIQITTIFEQMKLILICSHNIVQMLMKVKETISTLNRVDKFHKQSIK